MDSEYGLSRKFDKYGMPRVHLHEKTSDDEVEANSTKEAILKLKRDLHSALQTKDSPKSILESHQAILKKRIVTIGHDHPDTCEVRNIVCYFLLKQMMYEKAFMLHYQIKSARMDRYHLILQLYHEGEYEKAVRFTIRIYSHIKQISYTISMEGLRIRTITAHIYSAWNKYKEALKTYDEVYQKYFHHHGAEHPDTVAVQRRIAVILRRKGKYNEAMESFRQVMDIRLKRLGPEHEDTLISRKDIAELLLELGNYKRALDIYTDIYAIELSVRPNHPATLDVKCDVARVLSITGQYTEALMLLSEVYEIQKADKKYFDIRTTMNLAGRVLREQREYSDALNIFFRLYETQRNSMLEDSIDVEKNIASLLFKLDSYDDAKDIFNTLYTRCCKLLGAHHKNTLEIQAEVGMLYIVKEEFDQAMKIFKTIYEIQENKDYLGPEHLDTLRTKSKIAKVLSLQNLHTESLEIYDEVLEKMQLYLRTDNSDILQISCDIASVYRTCNKLNKAFQIYYEVYESRIETLGELHPDTLEVERVIDLLSHEVPSPKLLLAVHNNQLSEVITCIREGEPLTDRDIDGSSSLHLAAKHGFEEIVKCLLKYGVVYNYKNREGKKAKDVAANDSIKAILGTVEDAFKCFRNDTSEHLKKSIEKEKCIINARDTEGCTLLHWACSMGKMEAVMILLRAGANYMLVSNNGNTSLHLAISKGYRDIAEALLKYIKDHNPENLDSFINAQTFMLGTTCLHITAQHNRPYSTQLLLDYGANPDIRNKYRKLPVDLTTHYQVRQALIKPQFRVFNPFTL